MIYNDNKTENKLQDCTKNKNNIQKEAIEPKKEEIKKINKKNKKLNTSISIEEESIRVII